MQAYLSQRLPCGRRDDVGDDDDDEAENLHGRQLKGVLYTNSSFTQHTYPGKNQLHGFITISVKQSIDKNSQCLRMLVEDG